MKKILGPHVWDPTLFFIRVAYNTATAKDYMILMIPETINSVDVTLHGSPEFKVL